MAMAVRSLLARSLVAGLALALAVGGSACTAPREAEPVEVTPTTDTVNGSCVTDPVEVVTTAPGADATRALDRRIIDGLRLAAEAGLAEAPAAGAVVGVRTPDGTWTEAFGVADTTTGTPMTTSHFFRVGSVTKSFTATLMLQLAERGEVELDDTIDQYVPGVPNGDAVTIRMLLDMTSGLASYTLDQAWIDTYFGAPSTAWSPGQLLEAGLRLEPLFAPGTQFDYSNTNYVLLGMIIEDVTGRPFADVLETEILVPLGLSRTSFPDSAAIPAPHARGLTLQGTPDGSREPVDATDWSPSVFWAAGQMISAVDDLLVWGRALATGQGVLDESTSVDRLQSFPPAGGYGHGIGCVAAWVGHTGEIPGFNATVYHDTTTDTTVAVIANSDIVSGDCTLWKTPVDNPPGIPCMSPATRVFVAVSAALGHPFTPGSAR